jgi:hypothetical protein
MSDSDLRRYADKCDDLVRDDCSEPEGTPNATEWFVSYGGVFAELMPMP